MRFRPSVLSLSLLSCFFASAWAESGEGVPAGSAVIEADFMSAEGEARVEASGNVVLQKEDQAVRGERVTYLRMTEQLSVPGKVTLQQGDSVLQGRDLRYNLKSQQGAMSQVNFTLADQAGQGSAAKVDILDAAHLDLKQASFSTCTADDPDWQVRADSLELDRSRNVAEAHHAKLTFLGVPILYTPWIDFSLGNQRKSGFLAPKYGSSSTGGFEFMVPYYWSIAPNYDATFTPRFMEKRGWMLNNEFRYLGQNFSGQLQADALPWDQVLDRQRGRLSWQHSQKLPYNLNAYADLNRVSDDNYFRDLSEGVSGSSQVNLPQEVGVTYHMDDWQFALRAQQYQTLQDPDALIEVPYRRLPQLTFAGQHYWGDATLSTQLEYVDFRHDTSVNGARFKVQPSLSYLWRDPRGFYLNPKFSLHYSYYSLGKNNSSNLDHASRFVPIMSVDSGVTFEREATWLDRPYVQTLEPRAFYSYVPYRNQNDLPNFDSAQADFSFAQMFSERRFFGSDRIGDVNQLTLALSSRVLDQESGRERFKFVMGQRYNFETPRVYLTAPEKETTRSDVLLSASGQVSDAWSLDSDMQYDPEEGLTRRYNFSAQYQPEAGKVLNFGYRHIQDTLRYVDVSAQWPLSSRWRGVGRWNYSLENDTLLEGILGLEYNQQCWTLRLIGQQFVTAENKENKRLFVQLELNDLLRIGDDPRKVLKQSVPGYQLVTGRSEQE